MNEWSKTSLFVVAAVLTVGIAVASRSMSRPTAAKEFELVGEPFYPDFVDPNAARSLEVATYDEETSVIRPFDVSWGKNGWTISPYGYPADAKDQLEKTASSVIGIERAALASRRAGDHEQYGVIDPLSEDSSQLKGRGSRITIKDEKGGVLADYIVGKPVEDRDGYFYVRLPKEDETFVAKLDLSLSTRFADWIEADLLGISASDLKQIEILDYSLDEDRGTIVGRDRNVLARGEDFGPWTLEGLDEATEQINTANVNGLTRVLDEMKIIGVRPKPRGLNPDLTLDREVIASQRAADQLTDNLAGAGFFLAQSEDGQLQLVAREGQLIAATSDGIAYDIYFGSQFTGSQFDLEFGDVQDAARPTRLSQNEEKNTQSGRYVFIAARLDTEQLGEPPAEPAEPEPLADDASDEARQQAEADAKSAKPEYDAAKTAYDTKLADAKKRVDELNERFSAWYYVLSNENFDQLRLSREELVEPKSETPETPASTTSQPPMTDAAPMPAGSSNSAGEATADEATSIDDHPLNESGEPVEAPRPAAVPAGET